MRNFFLLLSIVLAPIFASSLEAMSHSVEMWWCSSCGLAYPASQKFCLNKDCPLFRKAK